METTPLISLETIAKQLKLDLSGVQRTAELLEEGNTVPFITRFRKDQTGGLDEQQVRAIEGELSRARLLSERKDSILKSIESRGKLDDELAKQIKNAKTMREVEDTYLPYKPKKQSLASIARSRGLEPLANSVLEAMTGATESIEEMAAKYVDESKGLTDVNAVLDGLKHLVAEHFGNHRKVRSKLRDHLSRTGRLVSKRIEQPPEEQQRENSETAGEKAASKDSATVESAPPGEADPKITPTSDVPSEQAKSQAVTPTNASESDAVSAAAETNEESSAAVATVEKTAEQTETKTETEPSASESTTESEGQAGESKSDDSSTKDAAEAGGQEKSPETDSKEDAKSKKADAKKKDAVSRRDQRRETRRRRRERLVQSFKDYFDFSDPIGRVPHHRILAINRGERTKVLRVKIECPDWNKVQSEVEEIAVPPIHPYADFLKGCLQDAMSRLLVPSIEREVRRELNDRAEEHAVQVFARNLRKLLLQPPLRQHRVIAIDPGFRSGCKLVALDEFGQMLGHTFINLLGKEQQKQSGREDLAKFAKEHNATVIAVGNGAACRETETLVAGVLSNELKDHNISYLIVNEAGTSVYSTSELGREELPDFDATVRSAVSIGRRSLDPLSELVKIDPASIGVGLYQHDVKAKHLRESLDEVVESCVNYVGVDVNSASPALLRYVSGLNSLTARKIYEHRQANGPFKNREELKAVSGIGDSTYVQAAGFLKIVDGDNPLDTTWIHPESYPTAMKVLDAIGFSAEDLRASKKTAPTSPSEAVPVAAPGAVAKSTEAASTDASVPTAAATATDASENAPSDATTSEQAESAEKSAEPKSEAVVVDAAAEVTASAPAPEDTTVDKVAAESGASPAAAAAVCESNNESAERMKRLREKLASVDVAQLATELSVGKLSLKDMLSSLARPGRDPREDLPPPIFRTGILKLEDLKPDMELSGTVLNVVDFGAFVDIGLVDSGLVHVSRLADRFVSDPHDVVSVGDILRVWVVEVDQKRRRVSLTAIEPGTEKPKPASNKERRRKPKHENKERSRSKRPPRGKGNRSTQFKSKAPPKPVVPITKEMEEGTEPMRTFGDLKQLFEKKKRGG